MRVEGVGFPSVDGRRSTQRTSREIFAHAAEAVDDGLAGAIADERDWRRAYPAHLRRLTARAAASPEAGIRIARAGLDRVHAIFEFDDGSSSMPLQAALARGPTTTPGTRTVHGEGVRAPLVVPYRGDELRGDALLRAADDWVRRGVVEPALRAALVRLMDHPEWLDLGGTWFAVLGAGAEMAPTEMLLRWGADVVAVDLPRPDIWQRIQALAVRGSGRAHVPVDPGATVPGIDLIQDAPSLLGWLAAFADPMVYGNYAYADGATFARLTVAADAVCAALGDRRADLSVVCLATPTDTFAVSDDVVRDARARHPAGIRGALRGGVHAVSRGRLLVPSYRWTIRSTDGRELGVADGLVLQQGPNYALAKRLQRWRAVVTQADGRFGAVHVAPPTRTRSVLRNRVLAAAYAGAPLFGIEIFQPATSRALMAALLVHDLRAHREGLPASPRPEHELTAAAAHGGLWRLPWEPRSALPLAVVRGAPALLRP